VRAGPWRLECQLGSEADQDFGPAFPFHERLIELCKMPAIT
jgi:hypothetical protein